MKRIGLVVLVTMLAAAGCGSKAPANTAKPSTSAGPASASGKPSGSASGSPSVAPTDLIEFTVDGAGPYQLGATLASLQTAGTLDEVKAGADGCPEVTTARGKGAWKDVWLSFHKEDGKMYLMLNKSTAVPTPSGAWLGTPLAQLKTIYVGVQGQDLVRGTASAYLVATLSGRGILFDLDPGKRVMSMAAGDANYLSATYQAGGKFC